MKESIILNNISSRLGIESINEIQKAMAENFSTNNIMLLSPTGSGKTLAFIIPVLKNLRQPNGKVQVVAISPSRELAIQTYKIFREIASDYKVTCCYGGHNFEDEKKSLSVVPDIIVATPGRMLDHIKRKNIDVYNVRILVVDEFDKALELGFQDEMERLVRKMPNAARHIFTSATKMDSLPPFIKAEGLKTLDYLKESTLPQRLEIFNVKSEEKDKLKTLDSLLSDIDNGRTIVFVNYRDSVDRVYSHLKEQGLPVGLYHGGLEQIDREKAVSMLNNGTFKILVTTDLGARGLDISDIKNVIHYHMPVTEEVFTHRNGRSARVDASGSVYVTVGPGEKVPSFINFSDTFKPTTSESNKFTKTEETLFFSAGKKEKISKGDILGFLTAKGGLEANEVGQIDISDHYSIVAIPAEKASMVLKRIQQEKIKNKKVKITIARQ